NYLRKMGAEFSRQYPKIAGRLELEVDGCPDPHIERMIESFAFLTGRVQYNIESELPQLSSSLLGVVYPQFINPTPSMSIARFEPDLAQGGLTSGYLIPKNTPLFTHTEQGEICRFRTCYPTTLWPVRVVYAGFESPDQFDFPDHGKVLSVLRIRLESTKGRLSKLTGFNSLRFYINSDLMISNLLYEMIFCNVFKTAVLKEKSRQPVFLPDNSLQPVGFGPKEDVLPYPPNAHSAYRLIHEYFTFSKKFLFFDVNLGTQIFKPDDTQFEILMFMEEMPKKRLVIDQDTFCIGCTPIINLFPKTSEPVRSSIKLAEYPLVADYQREKTSEIHSVLSVSASSDARDDSLTLEPYFSYNHLSEKRKQSAFYHIMRRNSNRHDLPGTQIYISFVDSNFKYIDPGISTIFAHTLCTNRRLAEQIPSGAVLHAEIPAPVSSIYSIGKPRPQIEPPLEGAAIWRLISHLSLNYLSLTQGKESLKALQEILMLYSFSEYTDMNQQITGIKEMSCKNVVRRMGDDAWRGFCRGIEITLTFDERLYVGNGAFLLASVLNHFFPLYASINTFTQLVIKSRQREGVWNVWPPMVGEDEVF
ncbi:type VI secretion system baseplate subunit TssF, partial [Desulfobacterales bacterium HSG17]|nr:type VI secretion system baseplate subunit TssF [Desulfobacterales bacterium HSG17]